MSCVVCLSTSASKQVRLINTTDVSFRLAQYHQSSYCTTEPNGDQALVQNSFTHASQFGGPDVFINPGTHPESFDSFGRTHRCRTEAEYFDQIMTSVNTLRNSMVLKHCCTGCFTKLMTPGTNDLKAMLFEAGYRLIVPSERLTTFVLESPRPTVLGMPSQLDINKLSNLEVGRTGLKLDQFQDHSLWLLFVENEKGLAALLNYDQLQQLKELREFINNWLIENKARIEILNRFESYLMSHPRAFGHDYMNMNQCAFVRYNVLNDLFKILVERWDSLKGTQLPLFNGGAELTANNSFFARQLRLFDEFKSKASARWTSTAKFYEDEPFYVTTKRISYRPMNGSYPDVIRFDALNPENWQLSNNWFDVFGVMMMDRKIVKHMSPNSPYNTMLKHGKNFATSMVEPWGPEVGISVQPARDGRSGMYVVDGRSMSNVRRRGQSINRIMERLNPVSAN